MLDRVIVDIARKNFLSLVEALYLLVDLWTNVFFKVVYGRVLKPVKITCLHGFFQAESA